MAGCAPDPPFTSSPYLVAFENQTKMRYDPELVTIIPKKGASNMRKLFTISLFMIMAMPLILTGCEFSASTANIASAVMSTDEAGSSETSVFAPNDTFYAVIELANAPDGTELKAAWTAVNVGEAAEPNLLLDEVTLETGSGQAVFDLANDGLWPTGQYKVDLFLDGEPDRTLDFIVQGEVVEDTQTSESKAEEPKQETKAAAAGPASTLEEVQGATIRIMSQGSFEDPEFGNMKNVPGQGSGFIIDPSGIAVTNNHVVTGAAFLEVFLDGEEGPRNAKILGVSECSDLAVIDIDGEDFPYLDWYEGDLEVGKDIYVAGFPLFGNEEYTLTRGIISKAQAGGETNWASVDHVLEVDATINGGNSGGPLVTSDGQVIGINYAGRDDTRQGFSISRDEAIDVIDVLQQGQDHNSIGINGQAVLSEDGSIAGIWVASVASGSPADNVGIQSGDIITELEGLLLGTDGTMSDYCDILRGHHADDIMKIEVLRFATQEILEGQLNGDPLQQTVNFEQELGDDVAAGESYSEYVTVNDDSGALTVEIPSAWSDVNGTPWEADGEELGPSVTAAPSIEGFEETWTTPGLFFAASESLIEEIDEEELLDFFDFSDECTYDERVDYADELYTGYYDVWTDCGGEDVLYIVLATTPESRNFLVLLGIQIVSDADLEALDNILSSFIVNE
jgi:serine protease Do